MVLFTSIGTYLCFSPLDSPHPVIHSVSHSAEEAQVFDGNRENETAERSHGMKIY